MFLLDSLMISGLRWTLETVVTAAEAEMNDDGALREQLLDAEMRRELGEIGEEEFRAIERDLLARIRSSRERRDGAGPLSLAAGAPLTTEQGERFNVAASLAGDFHDPGHGDSADQQRAADRATAPAPVPPSVPASRAARRRPRSRPATTPRRRS